MTISLDKVYKTANGCKVTVLCVNIANGVGGTGVAALAHIPPGHDGAFEHDLVLVTDSDGHAYQGEEWNLVEVKPWEDLKEGEPVMVRNHNKAPWTRAYFAGVREDRAVVYRGGATPWSAKGCGPNAKTHVSHWLQCRRPTPEELKA